ncbi:hypothetical protein ACNVED_07715 [Legionella sp. D16C41]|uniref:hypothetical protein n=1 Tax=Legionella sp. D16C41 TaxID=3402688 RepID=UPI003AF7DBDE
MASKKSIDPRDYELTEFDVPQLRTEPVQNLKQLKFPHFKMNTLLEMVSDLEAQSKQVALNERLQNQTKH